jgi:hypothetical protein
MASVQKHIARRQQQEARLLEAEEAEEQPMAVDTSGFLAWLLSLIMMILVRCNLMSPPMPCQSRARKGAPSRYYRMLQWDSGRLDCEGMSVCDLDCYTPY